MITAVARYAPTPTPTETTTRIRRPNPLDAPERLDTTSTAIPITTVDSAEPRKGAHTRRPPSGPSQPRSTRMPTSAATVYATDTDTASPRTLIECTSATASTTVIPFSTRYSQKATLVRCIDWSARTTNKKLQKPGNPAAKMASAAPVSAVWFGFAAP